MTHMIVSALIHGVIFDLVWRVLDRLPLSEAIAAGAIAIGGIWLLRIMFRKPRRRWR